MKNVACDVGWDWVGGSWRTVRMHPAKAEKPVFCSNSLCEVVRAHCEVVKPLPEFVSGHCESVSVHCEPFNGLCEVFSAHCETFNGLRDLFSAHCEIVGAIPEKFFFGGFNFIAYFHASVEMQISKASIIPSDWTEANKLS
jgi:hypothetical protein